MVVAFAPGPTSGAVGQNVDAWDILWNEETVDVDLAATAFVSYIVC